MRPARCDLAPMSEPPRPPAPFTDGEFDLIRRCLKTCMFDLEKAGKLEQANELAGALGKVERLKRWLSESVLVN